MQGYFRINTFDLEPGMRVAEEVETDHGAILVSPGTILNQKLINKLSKLGVQKVAIYSPEEEEVGEEELEQKLEEVKYERSKEKIMGVFENINRGKELQQEEVKEVVEDVMEINSNVNVMKLLTQVRDRDDYTYNHSVNVGLMAMMFGRWLDMPEKDIKKLTYAGFLHDIGKAQVPEEILKKEGPLTEEEYAEVKKHSIYGYKLVKDNMYISQKTAQAILCHHERKNGKGYPLGLSGEDIPYFARIIGIIDTYDAMTSDRPYKQHEVPFEVLKLLGQESLQVFDISLLETFTKNVASYHQGEKIRLNNGEIGELVFIDPSQPTSPIVKVEDHFIDLRKSNLYIEDLNE